MIRRFLAGFLAASLAAATAHAATPGVSAGNTHSLALHADGTVRAWGDDSSGALGLGRSLASPAPRAVGGLTGVVAMAGGDGHTLALRDDGTVWAWGDNAVGQLGDATTASRSTPAPIAGLSGIVEIAAGRVHSIARRNDGTVWTWGANYEGALGDERVGAGVPERVAGVADAVSIAAGPENSFAVRSDGTVLGWGRNDDGQLGDGTRTELYTGRSEPRPVAGLTDVVRVAGGLTHSMAVKRDGTVWTWGDNADGNLGDGTTTSRLVPAQVPAITGVIAVAAARHSMVLKNDGTVWAWGQNGLGQLGDDTFTEQQFTPIPLPGLTNVTSIVAAHLHAAALKADGSVWTWGYNEYGQLGDGTTERRGLAVPTRLTGGIARVALGTSHSMAVGTDGRAYAWGNDSSGQLGTGVRIFTTTPATPAISGIAQVSAGAYHSVALKADGTLVAVGNNLFGAQLGDGTRINRSTFVPVLGLTGVTQVSAGTFHTLARKSDGTVWAWGSDYEGRLGAPEPEAQGDDDDPAARPRHVATLTNVVQVAAGGDHSLALRGDGTVWAWGTNNSGQLGDGTTTIRDRPVQLAGLANVVEISAGYNHSLARTADGAVYAWGSNYIGQLGIGSNVDRAIPTRVPGLPQVTAISAGNSVSTAIAADRSVWAWGANYMGQVGDGSEQEQTSPVRLEGISTATRISTGGGHTLVLLADGSLLAWGINEYGQAGDGTLATRPRPVVVVREGGAGGIATNDWYLDLDPAAPTTIPRERTPVFLAIARASAENVSADIRYRQQDVGRTASTFVFAYAPVTMVRGASLAKDAQIGWKAVGGSKADPIPCALAQLNAQGQLVAVSAASLQAYTSGVLSAQGQSVSILNSTQLSAVGGATFFVGYGPDGGAMLVNGTTRSVVSVPATVSCRPQPPQTGWWWNPAEGGRGFTIEAKGNLLFMAAFHYDNEGRATWNYAGGPMALDGSMFTSDFLRASGGQTLSGPYTRGPTSVPTGPITLAFSDATHGTMIWPGGATPIERLPFIPGGLTTPVPGDVPEAGWWWNPQESGRGFFVEWQNNNAHIAGYMYDAAGNPTWYLSREPWTDPRRYSGRWQAFGGGQAAGGPYRPAQLVDQNVGALTIEFSARDRGTLTLPDGRRIPLERQAF